MERMGLTEVAAELTGGQLVPMPCSTLAQVPPTHPLHQPSTPPVQATAGVLAQASGVKLGALLVMSSGDTTPAPVPYMVNAAVVAAPSGEGEGHVGLRLCRDPTTRCMHYSSPCAGHDSCPPLPPFFPPFTAARVSTPISVGTTTVSATVSATYAIATT